MANSTRQDQGPRRGSATIEFAILLPILMGLGLLACDYGRMCHQHIAITNAARAGAAFGIMRPVFPAIKANWDAGIRQAVTDELNNEANGWFEQDKLVIPTPQNILEVGGFRRVVVEVRYPFQPLIPWPFLPGYDDERMLRRVVVMRGIR